MYTSTLLFVVGWLACSSAYVVVRNVKDYGAKGDGVTDDSAAIIRALTEGRADNPSDLYPNARYSPSTLRPGYIYFPAGTYKITQTLPVIYNTEMVGDQDNRPVIKFVSTSGADMRVLEAEGSWFTSVNQNNFYRQIRNFVIDMEECTQCTGVHWQVAQATSLTNVLFKCGKGSNNQGMWMENGSGGFFSDVEIEGGRFGMWVGNQQFTIRNVTIHDTSVAAIYLNWDWVWTFKGINIYNSPIGIDVGSQVGSLLVIDSHFSGITNVAIRTVWNQASANSANSLLLDNVVFEQAPNTPLVQNLNGQVVLRATGASTTVKNWGQGHVWQNSATSNKIVDLSANVKARSAALAPNGAFFERSRPLYAASEVLDVSTVGVVGDGVTDITSKLQAVLNQYANSKVLFFPYGTYIISNTVIVPPGTRMYGQVWSVLMAKGAAFANANAPVTMLQVGTPGQTGVAELSDLVISTAGPQPGAKLIEWNMHDPAGAPGSCGMWDVHFRIGGAQATGMGQNNCPASDGTRAPAAVCTGAWGLLHLTSTSSCYLENVWGWVADHDIENGPQVNIYNERGFLCESQGPVWLYGTAMEHNVQYQYNFANSKDVVMFTIQTETPYYQPSIHTPFKSSSHPTDPSFCTGDYRCNMAWALVIQNSSDIVMYGSGLYSFFNVWAQSCLQTNPPSCQRDIVKIQSSSNLQLYELNTYGSLYMLEQGMEFSHAAANPSTFCSGSVVDLDFIEQAYHLPQNQILTTA